MEIWVVLILAGLLMLLVYGLWADHRRIDRAERHEETREGHSARSAGTVEFDSRTGEGWGGGSGNSGGGDSGSGGGGS
ncbi:hypothetical protein [Catellatospora sp. NPDC049133]|uniref:hypothetical protein n=1 Tax=Catellatospora sp. NPDC049133 TaxID=3155499 RepID=UPI0033CD657B